MSGLQKDDTPRDSTAGGQKFHCTVEIITLHSGFRCKPLKIPLYSGI